MAYGISAVNNNGEVVIQDSNPIFVLKRSGTLSASYSCSYANSYGFYVSGTPAYATGNEEVFFSVPVGQWFSYYPWITFATNGAQYWYSDLYTTQVAASVNTLNYYIFDRIDTVGAATSGYGVQVYNSSGTAVWDSTKVTNRVSFGATVVSNNTTSQSTSVSSTANAISLRAWEGHGVNVGGNGTALISWAARRSSSSSWVIEKRTVDRGFFNGSIYYAFNFTITTGPARYLLAYT